MPGEVPRARREIAGVVGLSGEDLQSAIAALGDVMRQTRNHDTGQASYALVIGLGEEPVK